MLDPPGTMRTPLPTLSRFTGQFAGLWEFHLVHDSTQPFRQKTEGSCVLIIAHLGNEQLG